MAWDVFSKYIRTKYAVDGRVMCVTCGCFKPIAEMQAGHFVQGRHNEVLFDERNVHPQCYACNCCKHGNLIPYYEFMSTNYGLGVIEELKTLDKQNKQFTISELEEIKEKYSKLLKELQNDGFHT